MSDPLLPTSSSVEERLSHLDVARHSDTRVSLPRLTEQSVGSFAITRGGTVHEHHCLEATYLRLFQTVGNSFGLVERGLKVVRSSFPLMCRCRGHTRHRMREAENRPKRYRSSIDQLTSKRIKLASLRLLAEHNETLDYQRQHPP
jgi:hypothetical protein